MSETVSNDEKYLIFSVLNRRYSFPSRFISEIALFDTVYPLPLMPAYLLGIINRYSVPYALFDIGLLLFKTEASRSKVLVLKDEIDRIAFLIDDVIDIADVPPEDLFPIERGAESNDIAEIVSGSFKWNSDDVFVLDIQRIMARALDGGVF
ncbi:MAG: chemotaxis protein CheW [Treponema sp.]|jgi:purine-binding chemotaxis protein CheW|nr:chemotaxis protein CheW [Treponema sp.]